MSLINQMLRDLDQRQGMAGPADLPKPVSPAGDPARRRRWIILLSLSALAMAVLISLPDKRTPQAVPNLPVPLVVAPEALPEPQSQPGSPPEPGPLPAAEGVPSAAPVRTIEPVAPVTAAVAPRDSGGERPALRPSTRLSAPQPSRASEPGPEPAYREALQHMHQGRVREAIDGLRILAAQTPGFAPAWQVLVRLLLEQQRPDEAIRALREVVESSPGQRLAILQLARLQAEFQSDAAALATLRAHAGGAETDAEYHGLLAALLHGQGQAEAASAAYRQALALRPEEGRWWAGLGMALESIGRPPDEAWQRALRAANLPPDLRAHIERRLRER